MIFCFCLGHHQVGGRSSGCRGEVLLQMLRPQTSSPTVQGVLLAPQQPVHVSGPTEVRGIPPARGMEVTVLLPLPKPPPPPLPPTPIPPYLGYD